MSDAPPSATDRPATLVTPLSPEAAISRLEALARRGKLPGFRRDSGTAFRADAFGGPFDGEVMGTAAPSGSGATISFRTRLKPKGPAIWWAVLILTVWPGLPITESMLASLLPQWPWLWKSTIYWYLPLTVPFVPWLGLSAVRKSRRAVDASAVEVIDGIVKELGATKSD